MFVNLLADAQQLVVGLMPEEPYTFIDMAVPEVLVGALNSGDSTEVTFGFTVTSDALQNRRMRFFTRIREGNLADTPDRLNLVINRALAPIYAGLSALYEATNGDNWVDNTNWGTTGVPTVEELLQWHGITSADGWPLGLNLPINNLRGPLPVEIGNLSSLERLNLGYNSLTGTLPPELGNLSQIRELGLNFNSLSGGIPPELGNLSELTHLRLNDNSFTEKLPRSFMQLTNLAVLRFGGQALCAPQDAAFQTWLSGLALWDGDTCSGVFVTTGTFDDQVYEQGVAITDLVLPVASGGTTPYTYSLAPALPAGLSFDSSTRTLSGTPSSVAAPATYTYRVTDASTASDSLQFTVEVMGPVSREEVDELPSDLAMHGNYPNPFTGFTTFLFDLKEPAEVTVTVMDMLGRVILETGAARFGGGRGHRLAISGSALPAGAYVYRFVARTQHGKVSETGTMLHVK